MNEVAIIQKESIELIMQNAPVAYSENKVSHDRCIKFGQNLLATIKQQGMTDDIDQQAAKYINMSKATIKKMNEKRSPVTKIFDEIRARFTAYENEIDPTRKDTVPYQVQMLRDQYAAEKRAEEERKRQEIILRQQADTARNQYRADIEKEFREQFARETNIRLNSLMQLYAAVTLENYEEKLAEIRGISTDVNPSFASAVMLPVNVPAEALTEIRTQTIERLSPMLIQQSRETVEDTKQRYLDMLPSKKTELERAAKSNAEEAERIRQQMAAREAEEAARREAERKQREEQERQSAEMKKQAEAMDGLFARAEASVQGYTPKASVKKRLVPLNIEAFPEIISMWWTKEGQHLTVEELSKMFKKQITFCEKCAKEGELIRSEHIAYEDEVKAK